MSEQAKILGPQQEAALLRHLETTRYPLRDTAMFLLSVKAGLRAKEIASLTWSMVTDAEGQVSDTLHLEDWYIYEQREIPGPGWKVTWDGYLEAYHHNTLPANTVGKYTIDRRSL